MWATRRRTIILLIILGFFAVFVVLPYWLKHQVPPSCSDRKMNQGEQGIDCGGPCALVCPGGAKDISVLWTKIFPVRPGSYDVVAYVENANFNIAAPVIPYKVKLYDNSGATIVEESGQTYAQSNERFVIFRGNILTGDKVAASGGIEIPNTFHWYTSTQEAPLFSVENKILTGADSKPRLTALLKNDSPTQYRDIDVAAIIYDSKGVPIGVSSTRVDKIAGNSSQQISFTWTSPFNYAAETTACEVPADIILAVDRSGSMAEEGKLNAAKDAASQFVDRLGAKDQVAYVSFATQSSQPIDQILTADFSRAKQAIDHTGILQNNGLQFTNIGDGLQSAINEFATLRHYKDSRAVIILLTDGIPTRPEDPNNVANKNFPTAYAKQVADNAKSQGITLYTIGLGSDVDSTFLESIATAPEYYYKSATGAELSDVYQRIATSICKKAPSVIEIVPRASASQ